MFFFPLEQAGKLAFLLLFIFYQKTFLKKLFCLPFAVVLWLIFYRRINGFSKASQTTEGIEPCKKRGTAGFGLFVTV